MDRTRDILPRIVSHPTQVTILLATDTFSSAIVGYCVFKQPLSKKGVHYKLGATLPEFNNTAMEKALRQVVKHIKRGSEVSLIKSVEMDYSPVDVILAPDRRARRMNPKPATFTHPNERWQSFYRFVRR